MRASVRFVSHAFDRSIDGASGRATNKMIFSVDTNKGRLIDVDGWTDEPVARGKPAIRSIASVSYASRRAYHFDYLFACDDACDAVKCLVGFPQ